MTDGIRRILEELIQLSRKERAEIAHALLESLGDPVEWEQVAWESELDRRFREIDNGTAVARPAGDVLADLRRKHS
jgi:putative addiction module component (TIGR02574 family)